MDRYIRDNKVAVLIKPDSGWYTRHGDWNRVFDCDIVQSILDGINPQALTIEWVAVGTRFQIIEHQGKEMLRILIRGTSWITGSELERDNEHEWMVA